MANIFDDIITVIVGTVTGVVNGVKNAISTVEDFFYVKVRGLSFIVLGSRQTGKTTLIEWLRRNMSTLEDFDPEPTAAGGTAIPDFASRVDDNGNNMRLKANRDVGGEYAMWDTDWVTLFREAQPRGILFMMDHQDLAMHKDALNFVLQMIEDYPDAARNLKAFYVLVNKRDLWRDHMTLTDIVHTHLRNEHRRLKTQAERVGYRWAFREGSLVTGEGVSETMNRFFNAIRPKARSED